MRPKKIIKKSIKKSIKKTITVAPQPEKATDFTK